MLDRHLPPNSGALPNVPASIDLPQQVGQEMSCNINKAPLPAIANSDSILATGENMSERNRYETALRFIVEGPVAKIGAGFFHACVQSLAEIFQVRAAFITQLIDETCHQSRMLALWTGQELVAPYVFDLVGTPCAQVFQAGWGVFPAGVQAQFPTASSLATLEAESYLAVVINDAQGHAIGNLGIIDTKPLTADLGTTKSILQLFATHIGAEMARHAAEMALQDYADRQTLLNRLGNQIRHSLDLEIVIATTLAAIRELLDIDNCAFAWCSFDSSASTWHVIQEAKRAAIPSALGLYPMTLIGVPETINLQNFLLQVDDADQYPGRTHREFLQSISCKSEIILPIRTHAHKLGVIICVNHAQVRPWTASEIALLQAVSDQLAIAIDQADLYTASQAQSQELQHTLQELRRTQSQVLQNEKMSSLGQLVAGIAHEINNPVNFIHGNVNHASHYTQDLLELITLYQQAYPAPIAAIAAKISAIDLDFLRQDLPKVLTSMQMGTERIYEIVKSLRLFSRLDEAEVKLVDIHVSLDSTLMILQSRLQANRDRSEIKLIKNYGNLPQVECFASQLNQVFMNILANAIDAIEESQRTRQRSFSNYVTTNSNIINNTNIGQPTITIATAVQDNNVIIQIADNGGGIPAPIQAKIFDPFFTTKPVGKGTGMGLAISYQIITDKHGGQLTCHSIPGQGTKFIMQIPLQQLSG